MNMMRQHTEKGLVNLAKLMESVRQEHVRQLDKWGVQTHSLFEWLTYTTEELGELAEAIIEHEYRDGASDEVYKEAIQTATLALKIAEMASCMGTGSSS
jgi:NTP pyrophosphatase (non-canonical NTP hydrolase)